MSEMYPYDDDRTNGRPRKSEQPRIPHAELDKILVHGEKILCEDGETTVVHYPSYRDLANRFNVSNSSIAEFSRRHNCLRRRTNAQREASSNADKKLVEFRATVLAMNKDDELRIIDKYLFKFEQALDEGRVRFDNPGDFNTMLRLKQFVQGGADSRQEVNASLSLEDIQSRHKRMMHDIENSTAKERGERVYLSSADPSRSLGSPGIPKSLAPPRSADGELPPGSPISANPRDQQAWDQNIPRIHFSQPNGKIERSVFCTQSSLNSADPTPQGRQPTDEEVTPSDTHETRTTTGSDGHPQHQRTQHERTSDTKQTLHMFRGFPMMWDDEEYES